jgi:UDP-galactopyranose mutase
MSRWRWKSDVTQRLTLDNSIPLKTMHRQTKLNSLANSGNVDLICFSHLRWNFVYQRPQHLMSRFAKHRRVFFVEEPVFSLGAPEWRLSICPKTHVCIATPAIPESLNSTEADDCLRILVGSLVQSQNIQEYVAWFYTPMALKFAGDMQPLVTVYDCMDELSLFQGASPALMEFETKLFERADLVFTGGLSLYEAKCERHRHVYPFPSSVDVAHFAQARLIANEPADQSHIPHPRIGYAGVIDERIDVALIAEIALSRPDWQIVMIGPIIKISIEGLPHAANIHYLGMKSYSDLPAYFAFWSVAMLPFALNDATRFISPTKTPEYLAAGLPVVSTPIRDVVRPYGESRLAHIAADPSAFIASLDQVTSYGVDQAWRARADAFLSTLSWDRTWKAMNDLIVTALAERQASSLPDHTASLRMHEVVAMDV